MIPNNIELSNDAIETLRLVLLNDIGREALDEFTEKDLHDFGVFILTLTAIAIHVNINE